MGCCVICLVEERIEPRAFGSSFRRAKSSRLHPLLHGATRFQRTRNDGSSATRNYPCVSRVRGTLLAAAAPSPPASKSTVCQRRQRRGAASARPRAVPRRGKETYGRSAARRGGQERVRTGSTQWRPH